MIGKEGTKVADAAARTFDRFQPEVTYTKIYGGRAEARNNQVNSTGTAAAPAIYSGCCLFGDTTTHSARESMLLSGPVNL